MKDNFRYYQEGIYSMKASWNAKHQSYLVIIKNDAAKEVINYWHYDSWEGAYGKFSEIKASEKPLKSY